MAVFVWVSVSAVVWSRPHCARPLSLIDTGPSLCLFPCSDPLVWPETGSSEQCTGSIAFPLSLCPGAIVRRRISFSTAVGRIKEQQVMVWSQLQLLTVACGGRLLRAGVNAYGPLSFPLCLPLHAVASCVTA